VSAQNKYEVDKRKTKTKPKFKQTNFFIVKFGIAAGGRGTVVVMFDVLLGIEEVKVTEDEEKKDVGVTEEVVRTATKEVDEIFSSEVFGAGKEEELFALA